MPAAVVVAEPAAERAPCPDCAAARETEGWWARFNPLCVHCGARLVQRLQGLIGTRRAREIAERQNVVRRDWAGYGCDLAELDALAAQGELAMQPKPAGRRKGS